MDHDIMNMLPSYYVDGRMNEGVVGARAPTFGMFVIELPLCNLQNFTVLFVRMPPDFVNASYVPVYVR